MKKIENLTPLCPKCTHVCKSSEGFVLSCRLADNDDIKKFYKVVRATLDDACADYSPQDAQK